MKRTAALALTGSLALGAVFLAGCSSSSTSSTPAATTAASSSAMVGGNPGTWTPLDLTQSLNGTTVDMVVDQVGTFSDLPSDKGLVVESSDPSIVAAEQAEGSGDVTAVPAIIAKAPGTATITVMYADDPADQGGASNVVMQFTVNVAAQ